jgi:hypothetical protein
MKVLFLDIDGVLNNKKYINKVESGNALDPRCIMHLNHIIDMTGCKVVVSSAWRLYHTWPELLSILENAGVNTKTFIGVTRNLFHKFLSRDDEILDWLQNNTTEDVKYVVLDDQGTGLHKVFDNLVLTEFSGDGLNAEKAQKVIQLFGDKPSN